MLRPAGAAGNFTVDESNTASASWNDQGADSLDASDSVDGETDTYTWIQFQSQTEAVSGGADTSSSPTDENYGFDSAAYETSYVSATGSDTSSADEADSDSLTLFAGAVSYTESGLTDLDAALDTTWSYDSLSIGPSQFESGSAVVESDVSVTSAFETVGYLSESGTETIDSISDSTDMLNSGDVDYEYSWNLDDYGLLGTLSGSGDNSYSFNSSSETVIDSDSSLGVDEAVSYTHGGLSIVSAVADGTGTYVYESGASFPWQATDNFNLSIDYAQVGTSTHLDDGSYSFSYESGTETNRDDSYTASEYDGWYPDFPFTWNDNSGVSQAGFLNSFSHGDSSSGATTTVSGDEPSTFATYADETWGLPAVNPGVSAGAVSPTPPLMPSPAHPDLTLPLAMAPVAIAMHPDTSMMQGITNDDFSRTSPVSPTIVLTALAAAGRNPTDITIPTQAGTDGSGGEEDDAVAGGGTFEATDEPVTGGHEKSWYDSDDVWFKGGYFNPANLPVVNFTLNAGLGILEAAWNVGAMFPAVVEKSAETAERRERLAQDGVIMGKFDTPFSNKIEYGDNSPSTPQIDAGIKGMVQLGTAEGGSPFVGPPGMRPSLNQVRIKGSETPSAAASAPRAAEPPPRVAVSESGLSIVPRPACRRPL